MLSVSSPSSLPFIDSITVNKYGKVRRAKLYYLRSLTGKKARIKERRVIKNKFCGSSEKGNPYQRGFPFALSIIWVELIQLVYGYLVDVVMAGQLSPMTVISKPTLYNPIFHSMNIIKILVLMIIMAVPAASAQAILGIDGKSRRQLAYMSKTSLQAKY